MELLQNQAQRAASNAKTEAQRFRDEAMKKERAAEQLREEAYKEQVQGKVMRLAGPTGSITGPFRFYGSSKKEQEARDLEREAESLIDRAKHSEREARDWRAKARLARRINQS